MDGYKISMGVDGDEGGMGKGEGERGKGRGGGKWEGVGDDI